MKHCHPCTWALLSVIACGSPSAPAPLALPSASAIFPLPAPETNSDPEDNPWLDGFGGTTSEETPQAPVDQTDADPLSPEEPGTAQSEHDPLLPHQDTASPSQTVPNAGKDPTQPLPVRSPVLRLEEYLEGKGSDKILSFSNAGTGIEGSCSVELFVNGGTKPWRTLALTPLPAPGETAIYCSAAVTDRACTGAISGSTFNGNDALVVRCAGQLTDSFGQVGVDPGSGWASTADPKLTTKDSHWLRCVGPDLDPTDPFVVDEQWAIYPAGESLSVAQQRCATSLGLGGALSE